MNNKNIYKKTSFFYKMINYLKFMLIIIKIVNNKNILFDFFLWISVFIIEIIYSQDFFPFIMIKIFNNKNTLFDFFLWISLIIVEIIYYQDFFPFIMIKIFNNKNILFDFFLWISLVIVEIIYYLLPRFFSFHYDQNF